MFTFTILFLIAFIAPTILVVLSEQKIRAFAQKTKTPLKVWGWILNGIAFLLFILLGNKGNNPTLAAISVGAMVYSVVLGVSLIKTSANKS